VPDLKYRAFLSYSHTDTGMAQRVHRRLENFHVDKELIGRATPAGPIPKTLRPIFRDRHDFDAGSSLGKLTDAALDDSAALGAARSKNVNEEVQLFKSRHPDRPLIPVIVDGEPGNPEKECFPPALRFAVTPDGVVTDTPADVLAADLREKGDGFELALAKVVARLLGLAPDDVYRRADRQRRRQNRLRMAVAAVVALAMTAGGGFFWQARQQQRTLDEINALVDKYTVVSPTQATVPGAKKSLTDAITTIAEGAATDPRYAEALAMLKAGKPAEAEPLLKAVAEDKEKRAGKDAKDAAAAFRNLASIAAVSYPGRARDYYARAAKLDPSDIHGMLENGWFQEQAGQLDAAQDAYARLIAMAKPATDDSDLFWAKLGTGDIQAQRGNLAAALATYQDAEALADHLAKSSPDNAGWQRDLSASYDRVGNVHLAQGDLAGALKSYRHGLVIRERLARSDPGNADWQRDLSVSYDQIGDVQVAQGDLAGALKSYHDSLAIRERLAKSDAGNAGWQRDLWVSYIRVGDVQVAQADLAGALKSYRDSLAIAERLALSDPGNAGWQFDLGISNERIGSVQVAQGDLAAALKSYEAKRDIIYRLAKSDAGNADWQRDLSVSYEKIGDVQVAQGNLAGALKSYRDSLAIIERLAQSDAGNAGWQRDLSVSYNKIGNVQVAQGDLAGALKSYRDSLAIIERLAQSDAGNAGWQRDLLVSFDKIGDVQMAQGNLPGALDSYQAGLVIADRLAKSDAGNAGWQRDLSMSYARLASVYLRSKQMMQAREALAAGRAVTAQLISQHANPPPQWQQDLDWFNEQIAALKE
jgi:tetratricopeptide (TPR) repeat protein